MKWSEFRELPPPARLSRRSKKLSAETQHARLLREIKKHGGVTIALPKSIDELQRQIYVLGASYPISLDEWCRSFVAGEENLKMPPVRAPEWLVRMIKTYPEYILGLVNDHGEFIPGIFPILFSADKHCIDALDRVLKYETLSGMSMDEVVAKYSRPGQFFTCEVLRKRVSQWDRV